MKPKESAKQPFFFRFWWTALVLLFCYGFYLHGMHKKKEMLTKLKYQVSLLENQLCTALETREDLLVQIESQEDPAWTEMLIKKHLGKVAPNQTKVYFEKE